MCPPRPCQDMKQREPEPGPAVNTTYVAGSASTFQTEDDVTAQRVSEKIDETFARGALLSAHHITVIARDHTITLCGSVRCNAEREEAETAAWIVPEVAEVVNRLRITGQ